MNNLNMVSQGYVLSLNNLVCQNLRLHWTKTTIIQQSKKVATCTRPSCPVSWIYLPLSAS